MKKSLTIILPALFALLIIPNRSFGNEIEQLKRNYIYSLLNQSKEEQALINILIEIPKENFVSDEMVVELAHKYPISPEDVKNLLNTLQPDGSWPDIDYASKDPSGWPPKIHAERILILTKTYRMASSPYYLSADVEKAVHETLNYWTTNKPNSPNWWHNHIGVPKNLGPALLLFEEKLSPEEKEACLEIMRRAKIGLEGQNRVWLAGNVFVTALLENDPDAAKKARDVIASEIKISEKEGIKADNSFHQHGPQQQFGNYGLAFISSMSLYAQLFSNTSYQFDPTQLNILNDLINNGFRYILWNGYMDINALGRQIFNQSQIDKAFIVGFSAVRLAEVDPVNRSKYLDLIKDNFNKKNNSSSFTGLCHFRMSDMTVHRCPNRMTSVRMSSERVIGTEAGNGENLRGYYMADGATYTYVDGDEYLNIFPCWDWQKLPGVTCYEKDTPLPVLSWEGYRNNSDFVGNVSFGNTGLTAMELRRDGLSAKKAWIFTDDFVLCLGAGIRTDSNYVVTTSVEQQLKKGELFQLNGSKWIKHDPIVFSGQKDTRIHCGNKGYILMNAPGGKALTELRTGKPHDIIRLYPEDMIRQDEIFSLWISHDKQPQDASYQYLILPSATKEEIKDFNLKHVRIIHNTGDIQAVSVPKINKIFIAAYTSSDIVLPGNIRFKNDKPGLFILTGDKNNPTLTVTDPTQKMESAEIEINGKKLIIKFPTGNHAGSSVTVNL